MADDIKLENYKKNVAKVLDIWGADIADIGKKLAPLEQKLKELEKTNPDDKKQIEDLKKQCAALHKQIEQANLELKTNLMGLDVPPKADDKELIKLPAWIKEIIKKKGIPLGKDISIAPTVDFDFKSKKLKSFGLKMNW